MRLKKTLAFANGEAETPRKIRKLAYALTLSLPLLAACGAHAAAAPGAAPMPNQAQARQAAQAQPARPQPAAPLARGQPMPARAPIPCGSGVDVILRPAENVEETVCRFGREYVMTDSSLLIVTREQQQPFSFEPISLSMHASRTEMAEYRAQGIADWEPAEDSIFILTRNDRMLTRIPNEGMGGTVPAYTMPFDTSSLGRDSMVYRSGVLLIAPRQGSVVAMSFQGGFRSRTLPLRSGLDDAGFFVRGNALFFGKSGVEETEIRLPTAGSATALEGINLIHGMK